MRTSATKSLLLSPNQKYRWQGFSDNVLNTKTDTDIQVKNIRRVHVEDSFILFKTFSSCNLC